MSYFISINFAGLVQLFYFPCFIWPKIVKILKQQDVPCMYDVTWRGIRGIIVAVEKQCVLHILSVFVALVIQHAKRMHRIILSSVACLAVLYSSTVPHKRHDIRGNVTEHKTVF